VDGEKVVATDDFWSLLSGRSDGAFGGAGGCW
jgi:hypothetical protein